MANQETKKSPIKYKLLRYPGQSLDEKLDKIISDKVINMALVPTIVFLLTIQNWIYFYQKKVPNPIIITIILITTIIWSIFKFFKIKQEVKNLKLGRDGERAVGMYLDTFREHHVKVFHDIVGDKFNIDHILVCENGIFIIETKTRSKPSKGISKIIFDGEKIIYDNGYKDEKPLIQVQAEANWFKNFIEENTAKNYKIQPVILFPGWYIENKNKDSNIWVLNPKALKKYIQKSSKIYSIEDVAFISSRITQYVRNNTNI